MPVADENRTPLVDSSRTKGPFYLRTRIGIKTTCARCLSMRQASGNNPGILPGSSLARPILKPKACCDPINMHPLVV